MLCICRERPSGRGMLVVEVFGTLEIAAFGANAAQNAVASLPPSSPVTLVLQVYTPHSSVGIISVSKWRSNLADAAGEALLVEELVHGDGSFRATKHSGAVDRVRSGAHERNAKLCSARNAEMRGIGKHSEGKIHVTSSKDFCGSTSFAPACDSSDVRSDRVKVCEQEEATSVERHSELQWSGAARENTLPTNPQGGCLD